MSDPAEQQIKIADGAVWSNDESLEEMVDEANDSWFGNTYPWLDENEVTLADDAEGW